ncbi:MAG: urease accessory protein UreH domain-containing protein [Planctomycetota bacterium]|jgi:sulfite exporter TauE/SafE
MTAELSALVITAASIGFLHTVLGPDHYLPFIMMSWARKWSRVKTTFITFLCGLGHIASSVALGLIGVSMGLAVKKLELIESARGNLAAWLLIAFGLAYLVWGLRRAYRSQPHMHNHVHTGQRAHTHRHSHHLKHTHVHNGKNTSSVTPWTLFVIFVFGPCEPLIPILMYPAAKNGFFSVLLVALVFGTATITTMLGVVLLASTGVNFLPLAKVQRFAHVIAGASIFLCGLAIQFMGL